MPEQPENPSRWRKFVKAGKVAAVGTAGTGQGRGEAERGDPVNVWALRSGKAKRAHNNGMTLAADECELCGKKITSGGQWVELDIDGRRMTVDTDPARSAGEFLFGPDCVKKILNEGTKQDHGSD